MRVSSSAIGCSNSRKVVFTLRSVFYRQRVERAPEVPRGDRAPWPPSFAQPLHRAQRHLASLEVRDADALLQAEIVERQHVRAQQIEDQEHLGGPAPDAAYRDELGDDLLVRHLGPA